MAASPPPGPALSTSVQGALDGLPADPVAVTALIDAVLALHSTEYLTSWPWSAPVWPEDLPTQPVGTWMEELAALLRGPLVFGRIAVVGWSLLDDRVAQAAQASGLLAGVADGVQPALGDFLTPRGLVLLRVRAPLVALTVGELAPSVEVPTTGPALAAAVGRQPPTDLPSSARWAVADSGSVLVGRGTSSSRLDGVYAEAPGPTEGTPVAATESPVPTDRDRPGERGASPETVFWRASPVLDMGWSRPGALHIVTRGQPGVLRHDPATQQSRVDWRWPAAESACVGETTLATVTKGGSLWWASADGDPVLLAETGPGPDARLALAGDRVAVLDGARVLTAGPESAWSESGSVRGATALAATRSALVAGTADGEAWVLPWRPGPDPRPVSVPLFPGQATVHACSAGDVAVLASATELAAVRVGSAGEVTVVGRWRAAQGEIISTLAIGPDARTLLVALGDRVRLWRIGATPEVRLTSYTADSPDGDDLVGIGPTVEALAALVVARAVQPPLSIGLFGAWGTGKTFFMRMLERRVRELSAEAHDSGRAQASLWAWRNVRQVRFNAWHYAAADVWAGLLEQLVRQLARPTEAGGTPLRLPEELAELQRRRVTLLAGALERAEVTEGELRDAATTLKTAQERVQDQARNLVVARAAARAAAAQRPREILSSATLETLDGALRNAEVTELGGSLERTLDDIRQARQSVTAAAARAARPGGPRLALALVLVLLAGVAVTWALTHLDVDLAGVFGLLASALAAVGALARWLSSTADEVERRLALLDRAQEQARAAEVELQVALAASRQEVLRAETELAQARRQRDEARRAVADAQARVETATPGGLLAEYLEGRSEAEDYRRMLGLIGTVRRDLEVISDAVELNNQGLAQDGSKAPDDALNRVVLYVDDLDRCPPPVVVKVLEAVSMLLTFPLFVVVVAVDAHWISKSLADVYPRLLTQGDVTPDQYLEKIFQMPVWLQPPSDEAAATMARTLLGGNGRETPLGAGARPGPAPTPSGTPPPGGPQAQVESAPSPAAPGPSARPTTPPAAVVLERSEVAAIAELAPIVARSPRALKRYLNTYRVLKALVDPDDLAQVRLLLAVATGRPDLGERLLADIAQATEEQTLRTLVDGWPEVDRAWLADALPPSSWPLPAWEAARLQPVAHEVRRFLFHAEHPTAPERAVPEPPSA